MAAEGMILTNHDHQIRVGVLTGNNAAVPVAICVCVCMCPDMEGAPAGNLPLQNGTWLIRESIFQQQRHCSPRCVHLHC